MTVWVVKGGRMGEMEELALQEGLVVIDFGFRKSVTDFANRDELRDQMPERTSGANQLWRFANEMQPGDTVVMPRKQPKGVVAVGKIKGGYSYRTDLGNNGLHSREVNWQANDIPRLDFDPDLRNSMNSLLTVSQPKADNAEARIESIVNAPSEDSTPTEVAQDLSDDDALVSNLDEQIEDRIVAHIRKRFSGPGLERLVANILEASGYNVLMTRKGADGGVDVLAGKGDMGFDEPRLCVQVKSGHTRVKVQDYRALQGNLQGYGADQGLLVSLGGFTDAVRKENERSFFKIRLWGPYDVAQRLLATYDHLPQDIRAEIPLKDRKVLVEPEI